MENSTVCMMLIFTVLPFLFSQLNLGEATINDVAHWRYRRDNEDQYYDPSTRMSCPPSMLSAESGSKGDTAIVLIVDITKSKEKSWASQINLLMKAVSYHQGAKIAVVSIKCSSEIVLNMGTYTEDKLKYAILKQKLGEPGKGTAEAFNIAAQQLIHVGAKNRRVIVLSDSGTPKCVKYWPGPSEFDIADMWREEGTIAMVLYVATNQNSLEYMKKLSSDADAVIVVDNIDSVDKSVYQKIAKWLCTSVGTLLPKLNPAAVNKNTANYCTTLLKASTLSAESGSKGDTALVSKGDTALVLIVDITKAKEKSWPLQINLLMKAVSYYQGAKIAVVSINCPSEVVLRMGTYTEDELKNAILKQKPGDNVKKGTAQAFNIAAQQLIHVGAKNRRVIVLSDSEAPNCVHWPGPSEFDIADMWRREGIIAMVLYVSTNQNSLDYMKKLASDADAVIVVDNIDSVDQSVYQKIAKWLCTSVKILLPKLKNK